MIVVLISEEYDSRSANHGQPMWKSEGKYFIPATLAGNKVNIEMDVVQSDIPLLLSS